MRPTFSGLFAATVLVASASIVNAAPQPGLAVKVDVHHTAPDKWRIDYLFAQPVTQIAFDAVGDYRPRSWKVLTPRLEFQSKDEIDTIGSQGKPFTRASVEITTFGRLAPKSYAPFNTFSDGGTAFFLGHLQGHAQRGAQRLPMQSAITLKGMGHEHVVAPPLNRLVPGGPRGYAYFGPAVPVRAGKTLFLLDPALPDWARETVRDGGATLAAYYASAYQRELNDDLFIMASVAGFESSGLSIKGGAVHGQLSYRFEGDKLRGENPKKREFLARIVAHEMAHLWQLNVARGGVGEADPWIHEGGAEAMALDGLTQSKLWPEEAIASYRSGQAAKCAELGNTVSSYDGIYACGLDRFDKLGLPVVPLWRALIGATESSGQPYSQQMLDQVVAAQAGQR